jgi:putative lipoprotein
MRLALACLSMFAVSAPAAAEYRFAASGRYVCADGSLAAIAEQPYGTILSYKGREVTLSHGLAWSGFSYSGGGLKLRGRGEEGAKTLTITQAGEPPLDCRAVPAAATPGVATGTVTYLARIALPAGVVVTVELRDTARADAAAPLLARTEIRPRGNQVPFHWRLDFDARRAAHPARPSLSARITDAKGQLLWISDTFTPIPVGAEASHADAEIRLVPVRQSSARAAQ